MNANLNVKYAVLCLKDLAKDADGLSSGQISLRNGIPRHNCQELLHRLCEAGILRRTEERRYKLERSLEDLTCVEVLQAIWTERKKAAPFRLLYQSRTRTVPKTLKAIHWAQYVGAYPGEVA